MGHSLNASGKPTYSPTPPQTVADLQAGANYTEKVASLSTMRVRLVPSTAAGTLPLSSGYINLMPTATIPASPFGAGVAFRMRVRAWAAGAVQAGRGLSMRVQVDGAVAAGGFDQRIAPVGSDVYVRVETTTAISAPNVTHAVSVGIAAIIGDVDTVRTGVEQAGAEITLIRDQAF